MVNVMQCIRVFTLICIAYIIGVQDSWYQNFTNQKNINEREKIMFNNINLIDIKKEYDKYEAAIEKAAYFDVEKINIVECNPMNSLIL